MSELQEKPKTRVQRLKAWAVTAWGKARKLTPVQIALGAFALLFIVPTIQAFIEFWQLSRRDFDVTTGNDLSTAFRNIGLVLAGFITAGFVAWRNTVLERQANTAQLSLANTKLNDAFKDLAARRKETYEARTVTYEVDEETFSVFETRDTPHTIPDGATNIDRPAWGTESRDIPDVVTRAAAIDRLEGLAEEQPENRDRIASILCLYVRETSHEEAKPVALPDDLRKALKTPSHETDNALYAWTAKLPRPRSDRQLAIKILSIIHSRAPIEIDLSGANLQGMTLSQLNLKKANLFGAQMQGANLFEAQMQGANLIGAEMQGANLSRAQMQGVNLSLAEMQGANLSRAQMQGGNLSGAQMKRADLHEAQMQGANLSGAEMQGANLRRAEMQGGNLSGAELSEESGLTEATLRGAGVRPADDTTLSQLGPHLDQMFRGEDIEEFDDWRRAWRTWQDGLKPPLPPEALHDISDLS